MNQPTLRLDALIHPKAGSTASQCEDYFAYSAESCTAAVCDGAGTAFESRLWARLLAGAFVRLPPFGLSQDEVLDWADSVAVEWSASIPWQDLNVFEEIKARSGSAATLVGVEFDASPTAAAGAWRCIALGDSCLFQISAGSLATALPVISSAEFGVHPALFATRREMTEQSIGRLVIRRGTWRRGDKFLLLTDAIAAWFLREAERGGKPWDTLMVQDQQSFGPFVDELRTRGVMRNDDVTVVSIGVEPKRQAEAGSPAVPPQVWHLTQRTIPRRPATAAHGRPQATAGSGRPPELAHARPGQSAHGAPAAGAHVRRRRRTVVVASGLLLCAITLGLWFSLRGPAPSQNAGLLLAARRFSTCLVTFRAGDLPGYEHALRAQSTRSLDADLTRLLGLNPAALSSLDSQGQVTSISVASATPAASVVYAVVRQTITHGGAGQRISRILLIRLEVARSASGWRVRQLRFIASAAGLFPSITVGGHPSRTSSSPPPSPAPASRPTTANPPSREGINGPAP